MKKSKAFLFLSATKITFMVIVRITFPKKEDCAKRNLISHSRAIFLKQSVSQNNVFFDRGWDPVIGSRQWFNRNVFLVFTAPDSGPDIIVDPWIRYGGIDNEKT